MKALLAATRSPSKTLASTLQIINDAQISTVEEMEWLMQNCNNLVQSSSLLINLSSNFLLNDFTNRIRKTTHFVDLTSEEEFFI